MLLPLAGDLHAAGERLRPKLSPPLFWKLADAVPDAWLAHDPHVGDARGQRHAYVEWLSRRLAASLVFQEEANRARALRV